MSWWSSLWRRRPSLSDLALTLQRAASTRGTAWTITTDPSYVTITGTLSSPGGTLHGVITPRHATYTLRGGLDGFALARARDSDPFEDNHLTLDSGFDERIIVRGDDLALASALSSPARTLLSRAVINHRVTILDGHIHYAKPLSPSSDPTEPLSLLEALHASLCAPPQPTSSTPSSISSTSSRADLWLRVAANAAHDPLPQVRKRCLKLLLSLPSSDPIRALSLAHAQSDRRPDIALIASEALGASSVNVPAAIAADPLVSTELRRQAFAHAAHFSPPPLRRHLTLSLLSQSSTPAPLLRDAILALDASNTNPPHTPDDASNTDTSNTDTSNTDSPHPDLPHLLQHLCHDDPTVLDALARALRRTPCPDAERALLHILTLCPHDQPKLSAAQSLGLIGSAASVQALTSTTDPSTWRPLRDASRISLQHIRARLLNAGLDSGHLSLSEPSSSSGHLAVFEPLPP